MSADNPDTNPDLSARRPVNGPWLIAPLVSAIGFFVLFCYIANRTELDKFAWPPVLTNVIATASNSPSSMNATGTSASAAGPVSTNTVQPSGQTFGGHIPYSAGTTNTVAVKTKQPADRLTRELSLRMFWAVSVVVFAALCFAVVGYAIQIIREILQGAHCAAKLVTGGLGIVAVTGFLILLPLSEGPISVISGGTAAEQLFQLMGNETGPGATELNASIRIKKMLELKKVRSLVTFVSAASKLGLVFVAIAACMVLAVMRKEQDEFTRLTLSSAQDADRAKFKYERRVEITVSLLQLTACALVAGVVQVYLLYNMASYYVDQRLQNDVQSFAQSLATVSGLIYSGLLVAIYLPLVAGQRAIGRELIDSHGGDKVTGKDTKFVAQLYDPDPKKAPMIAAILTVFSPLLVAFLTKLTSSLMDHL